MDLKQPEPYGQKNMPRTRRVWAAVFEEHNGCRWTATLDKQGLNQNKEQIQSGSSAPGLAKGDLRGRQEGWNWI